MQDQSSLPWYVARLKPNASRVAPERVGSPLWRQDETMAERSLRDAGFDCYFPRMRNEKRHHRTQEVIVKTYPLFVGYLFVDAYAVGRARAADCDVVAEILGERLDGRPWPVPARMVRSFMEAERELEFAYTSEARRKRMEEGRSEEHTSELQSRENLV